VKKEMDSLSLRERVRVRDIHHASLFALTPDPSPMGRGETLIPSPSPMGRGGNALTPNPSPIGRGEALTPDSSLPTCGGYGGARCW